jgi:uncharacterized membrane protein
MKQKRYQSKVVWITAAAIVGGVIKHYIPGITDDYQLITDAAIALLALFGVLNDPTTKGKF